jgi:hypothetical protein
MFNDTFNNISAISWKLVLLVEKTGVRFLFLFFWGCRGRDHLVVEFTATCAISSYHH